MADNSPARDRGHSPVILDQSAAMALLKEINSDLATGRIRQKMAVSGLIQRPSGWITSETCYFRHVVMLMCGLVVSADWRHQQEFDSMKSAEERGRISSRDFVTMFQEMATRPEIHFLLIRFANKDFFTADDFRHFLECEQDVSSAIR